MKKYLNFAYIVTLIITFSMMIVAPHISRASSVAIKTTNASFDGDKNTAVVAAPLAPGEVRDPNATFTPPPQAPSTSSRTIIIWFVLIFSGTLIMYGIYKKNSNRNNLY